MASQQADLFGPLDKISRWRDIYDDGSYPTDFWEWLRDNQHVLDSFIRIALEAKNKRGFLRWSARSIIEVLRWQTALREGGQDILKVNDHSVPGLARLSMKLRPELEGFFSTRTPPAHDQARRLIDGQLYGKHNDDDLET